MTYTFELPQGRYAIGVFHDAIEITVWIPGSLGFPKSSSVLATVHQGDLGLPPLLTLVSNWLARLTK